MFGLDNKGFKRKKYSDIVESMEQRSRDTFGENINLNDNSFLGMLIKVFAWSISLLWEMGEKIYFNKFVDYAEGNGLSLATRNNGIARRGLEKARGIAIFDGAVPTGFLVKINDVLFETIDTGTVVQVQAMQGGSGSNFDTVSSCEIVTPIPGVTNFTISKTEYGRDIETDPELRTRFFSSLASAGASTVDSIISALLRTEGVRAANVQEIEEGGYYKGTRAVVLGGTNDNVAQTILSYKAFGVKTLGASTGNAIANNGDSFVINFDYASEKKIDVNITITKDASASSNANDLVKEEIENYIKSLNMGEDVIYSQMIISALKVQGILDVDVQLKIQGSIIGKDNLIIGFDEVATVGIVNVI